MCCLEKRRNDLASEPRMFNRCWIASKVLISFIEVAIERRRVVLGKPIRMDN
jgi:hypothetical protein